MLRGIWIPTYHQIRRLLRRMNLGMFLLIFPRDFEQDGLATSRLRPFETDDDFLEAKNSAIRAIGRDFGIDWRSHNFLWAFMSSLSLPGCAVELGTGKAWMFSMALYHPRIPTLKRAFLIDRFSEEFVDSRTGQISTGTKNPFYTSDFDGISARFESESDVRVVRGNLPGVLESLPLDEVRFVHVDLNAAEPEVQSLRILWPRLVPGAFVLLDDFGSPEFRMSNLAMRELSEELGFEIMGLPTGQGLIVKN